MANPALASPTLLTDPGYLYWAPLGSAVPAMTVVASKFSVSWAAPWIPMGATEAGSEFSTTTTVSAINVAELLDAVAWRATDRTSAFTFAIASVTASQLSKAFNGAQTAVTQGTAGDTTTQSTQITPVTPGSEVRAMIGWESYDSTTRIVGYQCFNGGNIKLTFAKAPSKTAIPWQANLEVPSSGVPWNIWTAGAARA